jgi:hypothetical protein
MCGNNSKDKTNEYSHLARFPNTPRARSFVSYQAIKHSFGKKAFFVNALSILSEWHGASIRM